MTRDNKDTFRCIVCKKIMSDGEVLCCECRALEINKQKSEKGSVTEAQIYKINKLSYHLSADILTGILKSVMSEYEYNTEDFSCDEAKIVIGLLMDADEKRDAQPPAKTHA